MNITADINRVMKTNAFLDFCADDITQSNAGEIVENIVIKTLGIARGIYSRNIAIAAINRVLTWK